MYTRSHFWIWICILYHSVNKLHGKVTDAEYALMPPVYHYDDFDRCMLLGKEAVYCSTTIQLSPVDSKNSTNLWKIIEEASKPQKNYLHYKLRHGVCIWESCKNITKNELNNEEALRMGISECYSKKFAASGLKAEVTRLRVQRGGLETKLGGRDILLICFVLVLGILLAWGTIYEVISRINSNEEGERRIKQSRFGKLITCFSIQKSWESLFSPFQTEDATALKCIQGLRFFTMLYVINVHTHLTTLFAGIFNTRHFESILGSFGNVIIINNFFVCQGFLVISGWLLAYSFFLNIEKGKNISLTYFVRLAINRYVRLTPSLLVLLVITSTDLLAAPGPITHIINDFMAPCHNNWWSNILYINNYYDTDHLCVPHSWYLATDFQLYLLSLVILGIIWKFQNYTNLIFGISLTIGVSIPGIMNYYNDYDIVMRMYSEGQGNTILGGAEFTQMYIPAHTNIGAYIIGLIFGYIFCKTRNQEVFTNKVYIYLWYILVIFPPLIAVFLGVPIHSDDYEHNPVVAALYVSLSRNGYALSMALIVYGVSQGLGSLCRDVLIWTPFQVLGKLCYCTYVFHPVVLILRLIQQRGPSFYNLTYLTWENLGDVATSFLLALVACLCIEMPAQALQKLYIPPALTSSTVKVKPN